MKSRRARTQELSATPAPGARRGAGELEDEVIAALWASAEPLTANQIRAALGGDLAPTTVLTTLSRLLAKGVVERTKVGRAHTYRAVIDGAERTAEQMRRLLDRLGDHEAVLARFVEGLSPAEERVLRRLLGRR